MSAMARHSDSGSIAVTISALRTLPRNRNRMTTMRIAPSSKRFLHRADGALDQLRLIVERPRVTRLLEATC